MKELLKKLIQAESTPQKGELATAEVISGEFAKSSIKSNIETWQKNRANIITHIKSHKNGPALLFACHLDVVGPGETPWKYPVFGGLEDEGRIYGRGSTDMKGGIASIVTAIRRIVDSDLELQGDLIFTAVAGEETDSCGAKRFIENSKGLLELAGVVIPEPTDFSIATAHRGMLWLEVVTKGKTAHSSTPQQGVNAIASMNLVLNELADYRIPVEPHPLLGPCSMSINMISGGKAMNVIPDKCSIGIDIRTLPQLDERNIFSDIEKIFSKLKSENKDFDAEVTKKRTIEPLETDSNCNFVKKFCSAAGITKTDAVDFTTDGSVFKSLGVPIVIFGPGKPNICHKPDEYIETADLEKAVEYYINIISRFLG
jgi:succinyl-diaminopimelate desuccinylase